MEELVVQPLLVSISALTLATETVRSILKIDDVVRGPVFSCLLDSTESAFTPARVYKVLTH